MSSRGARLAPLWLLAALAAANAGDFGRETEHRLHAAAHERFGIEVPLPAPAAATSGPYRRPAQTAAEQLQLAPGLEVEYLTRTAADRLDMLAFFPADKPTHLVACVESRRHTLPDGRLNPSVQRLEIATGEVETIVRGLDACDGIRATPCGTILATEEAVDGGAWEILDPLHVSGQIFWTASTAR